MAVDAMQAGAVEFLTKPYRKAELLDAIRIALERDRVGQQARREADAVRDRYARLTARETGCREIHSSAGMPPGGDVGLVRALRAALDED